MASKECFHFTKLDRMFSIRDKGLECRLEDNSKAVSDSKAKISFSDSKIGAIGLYSNFEQVYLEFKIGIRLKHNTPEELKMRDEILASKNMNEFLGDGPYLIFDGTDIGNEGGNTGHGGIYDASTRQTITPDKLSVGLIRNNDTGEISYSREDYIHFLMSKMTDEEYMQMIKPMQESYDSYYENHKDEIDVFKNGNYSKGKVDVEKFCEIYKNDILKANIEKNKNQNSKNLVNKAKDIDDESR